MTTPRLRARSFASKLLAWYDRYRRDLPWRRSPSPYKTFVSEAMLQQTVVAAVIPYFERFIARFPDFPALAAASEGEVLALWSGLGYYRRGRNLHAAARAVVTEHGGRLPKDDLELLELPGVGPYTAAAVAAIAFDVPTFALDGNAARVVARLAAVAEPIDEPAVRERLRVLGQGLVPKERAGDFAQAVMELGATVCTPRSPSCTNCPVATLCRAQAAGLVEAIPARSPRRSKKSVAVVAVAVQRAGRVLLVPRADGELLAGTFALPEAEVPAGADLVGEIAGVTRVLGRLGTPAKAVRAVRLGEFRHVFTHRDVTASVYATAASRGLRSPPEARWQPIADADADQNKLAIASYTRKALALLAAR